MSWLETIEIRSAGNRKKLIEAQLEYLISSIDKGTRGTTTIIYKLATMETDFSIHLLHNSGNVGHDGSLLGQHLASALKEFGLVSHRVWIEAHERQ